MNKRRLSAIFISAALCVSCTFFGATLVQAAHLPNISATELKSVAFSEQHSPKEVFELTKQAGNDFTAADQLTSKILNSYSELLYNLYVNNDFDGEFISTEFLGSLKQRQEQIAQYAKDSGQRYIDAAVSLKITSVTNQKIIAYEWVMLKYEQSGYHDYSGYGLWHTITMADGKIANDEIENDPFIPIIYSDETTYLQSRTYNSQSGSSAAQALSAAVEYSPDKSVQYADKYALQYNASYRNFNSVGGDCANYVSQCLLAGGFPMSDDWYYKTADNYSASWSFVSNNIAYFSQFGKFIKNPTASQILKGNPVYYYSSATSTGAHTAICVGTNTAGSPIINAHNNDRYHVDWQLGGVKYFPGGNSTIQLNGSAETVETASTTQKTTAATTASTSNNGQTVLPTSATTTIAVQIAGDVNDDGTVNTADVLALRKHLANFDIAMNKRLADVNADGSINSKDLLLLRKFLAGWNVELTIKS